MMKQILDIIEIWKLQGGKIIEENPLNNYKLYFEGLMMNFATQKQHSVHNEMHTIFLEIKLGFLCCYQSLADIVCKRYLSQT